LDYDVDYKWFITNPLKVKHLTQIPKSAVDTRDLLANRWHI